MTPSNRHALPGSRVLIVSNGHGEDLIGATLGTRLARLDGIAVAAFPLVGVGRAYAAAGIPLEFTGVDLPSGGFVRHGLRTLAADAVHGGLRLTIRQVRALHAAAGRTSLAICVGDCLLIAVARLFLRRPLVFLPTAKSDYIQPHLPVEIRLMHRYCLKVFTRDPLTASSLAHAGVPAEFAGNIMMDALFFGPPDLNDPGTWTISVLPGSRAEAYDNLALIAPAILSLEELASGTAGKPLRYLVALAGGLSFERASDRLHSLGWIPRPAMEGEGKRGVVGHLEHDAGGRRVRLTFTRGRFADVLAAGDAVLGLAGTANEQAAGLGKPVVTFAGRGPQITPGFVQAQKKLLGEAVCVTDGDPDSVARELLDILSSEDRRTRMSQAGRTRMGPPGGAERIAEAVARLMSGVEDKVTGCFS